MDYHTRVQQEIERLKEDLIALVDHPTLTADAEAMSIFDRINEAKEILSEVIAGRTKRAEEFLYRE